MAYFCSQPVCLSVCLSVCPSVYNFLIASFRLTKQCYDITRKFAQSNSVARACVYNTMQKKNEFQAEKLRGRQRMRCSLVIKQLVHAFSSASIALGMYAESLESTPEARVALGCASNNSYASLVLSKLPACIHNSMDAR